MKTDDARFELIRRCYDGEASAEEFAQLEAGLREDADFLAEYVRYMNVGVALHSVAQGCRSRWRPARFNTAGFRGGRWRRVWFSGCFVLR